MSIQSEINRLNAAKAELKTSIENGGVTVSLNAKIDAYPALVDAITQQIKDKVDAINGEVVEGDVDAKLNKITSTKTDLAAALAEKGQTVGDVFSTYGDAVRAIETGGAKDTAAVDIKYSGAGAPTLYLVDKDYNYITYKVANGDKQFEVNSPSIITFSGGQMLANASYSGKADKLYGYDSFATMGGIAFYIHGNCSITV